MISATGKPRPCTQERGKQAVTFIELLLVIVIIGSLTALSIPQLRKTFDNFALENFVQDIYYLSRALQANAVSTGKIYVLNILAATGEFQAAYKEKQGFKNLEGRFGRLYKAPKDTLILIEPADKTKIYFYPDAVTDKTTITFENKYKKQISLILKGISGDIQIQ